MSSSIAFFRRSFALILPLILLAGSCAHPPEERPDSPGEAEARLVEELPAGQVGSGEALRVRFVREVAAEHQVGAALERPVFSFEPEIAGVASWEDGRTLIFKPNRPLPMRQDYLGELDLGTLFPGREDLAPLKWVFAVAGREIASLEGEFALERENDPRWLRYAGEVRFTEAAALARVREAAELRLDGESVPLVWEGEGRNFRFVSDLIQRGNANRRLAISIEGEGLELSQDYRRELTLPPLRRMQVVGIEQQEGEEPGLTVEFSDELDARQEIAGLIGVEPAQPLRLKVLGRKVIVQGAFVHGHQYELLVHAGIRSRWGTATRELTVEKIAFADRKPQIRFARDGVFLPSANEGKLRFSTLNLTRVEVEVKKVFADNLGFFLQTEQLSSARQRRDEFNNYFVSRVGVEVAVDTLEIGGERNVWLQHELDLRGLIEPGDLGLYLVGLSFGDEDMLYGSQAERAAYRHQPRHYSRDDYYNHPYSPGYAYTNGQAYKAVMLSDIGLTGKKAHDRYLVWATRIGDAAPLADVQVTLRSYQNQAIARMNTDADGLADFRGVEEEVFYVEAEKEGQRSLLKPDEMAWNLSSFETGGKEVDPGGTRLFTYTERGVYRPGDSVHVAVIARHADHTFPEDHPLSLKVFNPREQPVFEETQSRAQDGFYSFAFATEPGAPTGNWRMEVLAGSQVFSEVLKIETVAPQRLDVEILPERERLGPEDRELRLGLKSAYLFGNPASGLEAQVDLSLRKVERKFARFPGFSFVDESLDYEGARTEIFRGPLDGEGRASISWELPSFERVPSGLEGVLNARVLEKGGRPNRQWAVLPIDPYSHYVGLQKPDLEYGYARTGSELKVSVVVVDDGGEIAPGRGLSYRIYRGELHWWWEYENREDFRLRFRSARNTELVEEGELTSGEGPVALEVDLKEEGEYLIEVRDGGGHGAAFFLRAYPWGDGLPGGGEADALALRTDREEYAPGETAVLRFPLPRAGTALVTVEQDARLLQSRWYPIDGTELEARVEIPIEAEMAPNVYATVSVIQPHAQTANDRPLRMYGVVPIRVEDAETRQELELELPVVLRPGAPFAVEVQTGDGRPTQFTLAVVDEGLLSLTNFATPDPWKGFFEKVRLSVQSFDLFAQVIGAHRGDVFRTFAIGGGMGAARRPDGEELERLRRFEPVSMFRGPLETDEEGYARVEFEMPRYVGAVRVMAVAARGRRYGHAEQRVPVKSELMVMPTLPRVLGPGDRFQLPVTVFAMEKGLGRVRVEIEVEGPVGVEGSAERVVESPDVGEADVEFGLTVEPAVGTARIRLRATAENGARATQQTHVEVRPSAQRVYEVVERPLAAGDSLVLQVPDRGIRGSNRARVAVRRGPALDLEHRYRQLLRYPYGCIEQTVSAVFPQLYLKGILEVEGAQRRVLEADIDRAINEGIARLRRFRLPDGSFSYWPGGRQVSAWCNLYAGHFLIAARDLGYHVPEEMLGGWLRHQQSQALTMRDDLRTRTYRAYLLALAGEPSASAMNLLRENGLADMDDTEKWMLASAYRLAGAEQAADRLARDAGTEVREYRETGGTYGSGLRDRAIILDALVGFQRWERADVMAGPIARSLSGPGWLSTQTAGYCLMALGKYLESMERGEMPVLAGTVRLPNGEAGDFETEGRGFALDIEEGFGGEVMVRLDADAGVERGFVSLAWEGIPLVDIGRDEAHGLGLAVEWLDDNGARIDPARLAQGTSFWGHLRVRNPEGIGRVEEIVLTQVLPAGWEVRNLRLSGEERPGWTRRWRLGREEYLDVRDDRVNWFFDLGEGDQADFLVGIDAVTVGAFALPASRVGAMYDREIRAGQAGGRVVVVKD